MGKSSHKRRHRSRSRSRSRSHTNAVKEIQRELRKLKEEIRSGGHLRSPVKERAGISEKSIEHRVGRRYHESEHYRREDSRSFSSSERSLSEIEMSGDENEVKDPDPEQKYKQDNNEDVLETEPLDEERLELVGDKVLSSDNNDLFLHPEIGDRWQPWLQVGLKKEEKQDLLKRYARKDYYHLEAPELNPEVEASINESVKKRDKLFTADQNTLGLALSALGIGLSVLLRNKNDDEHRAEALKPLLDAGKLLSEAYFQLSKTRKAFIYPSLDRKAKDLLERTKTDSFLFGKELSTRFKTEKSMEKVGLTLKPQQIVKKIPTKSSTTGNWRAPPGKSQGFSQADYKPTVASFHVVDSVQRVLSTQLTVDWTLECVDGAMFHLL